MRVVVVGGPEWGLSAAMVAGLEGRECGDGSRAGMVVGGEGVSVAGGELVMWSEGKGVGG